MLFKPSKVSDSRQGRYAQKHSTNSQLLMLTGLLATVVDAIINLSLISFVTFAFLILGMVAIAWRRELDGLFQSLTKFSQRYKITSSALTVIGIFLLLDALSNPAQAQFFQNAETWMTGQFTGADEAITLSFNVLRGLFILYLGISLVRVVQAARQDEDWQNLARTPMIILIAVTMGDILANLIIGGGT
jgi:type IV secretory pathway TrbD component